MRIWSSTDHECICLRVLPFPARAVAYAPPSGETLAVGADDGTVLLLDALTLREVVRRRNRTEAVRDLKFSPDGCVLAVTGVSHSGGAKGQYMIDLYDVGQDCKRVGVCKGHSSAVEHLDWSADSTMLRSTSRGGELLFHEARGGCKQVPRAATLRDMEWATCTCKLGWEVQGVFPKSAVELTYINSVDRDRHEDKHGSLLVTADRRGLVSLLCAPSTSEHAPRVSSRAHGEQATCARFSHDAAHVLSKGGADLTICQWRRVRGGGNATAKPPAAAAAEVPSPPVAATPPALEEEAPPEQAPQAAAAAAPVADEPAGPPAAAAVPEEQPPAPAPEPELQPADAPAVEASDETATGGHSTDGNLQSRSSDKIGFDRRAAAAAVIQRAWREHADAALRRSLGLAAKQHVGFGLRR